jgi:hypothetical protein
VWILLSQVAAFECTVDLAKFDPAGSFDVRGSQQASMRRLR